MQRSSRPSALEAQTEIPNLIMKHLSPPHPLLRSSSPTSNIIHHRVSVAGSEKGRADGEFNNCSVNARDAIRIQRGSKYKYKQTRYILLKDAGSPQPPPFLRAANESAQQRDESALMGRLGLDSQAWPASPRRALYWKLEQRLGGEGRRGGETHLGRHNQNPSGPSGKQREGCLVSQ